MKSNTADKKKKSMNATQANLPIAEIKDGVVVLKDGTLRSVILVSSINFALKSEDEQNAIISSYVGFLNSIDFPLQIVVQSRRLQIKPYIEDLIQAEQDQENELLKVQIADYRAFVQELVEIGQIMTKRFYVVVPFDAQSDQQKSFFTRFKEVLRPALTVRLKEELFEKRKYDLDLRVRHVMSGLESIGLQVAQLDTQSLIELYYTTYNPDIAFAEELADIHTLRIEEL
jgi:type IV secretory pathway VirB4 component